MRAVWLLWSTACAASGPAPDTGQELCDAAPVLTWENFGHGLVVERCQSCHASTASERHGAPDDVVFDTHAETLSHADRILLRVVEEQTMPPQGGISVEDLERIELWLRCEEGVE